MSAGTTGPESTASRPVRRYRFGRCEIDTALRELRLNERPTEVQPLVLDLLVFLIERRDRTVDKDELLAALWPGSVVTESSLTQAIRKARAVVGDDGERQHVIRTVSRRGYRFVAPLEVIEKAGAAQATADSSMPRSRQPRSFLGELQRRHVLRVALLYLAISWLLLQAADILLPTFDVPAWGMRLVVALLVMGFPATLVFAWIFDLTPEGLKRDDGSPALAGDPTNRRFAIGIVLALMATAGLVVLAHWRSEPAPQAPTATPDRPRSIAVLPFANDSADPGNEYFSDGIAEELLNRLAGVPELHVVARTSSFRFRDPALDVREIGDLLDVRHVVEGMVRRDGDRVRISAQLIDAASGYHVWSDIYEARLEDVFAVQNQIAGRIARQLELVLTPGIGSDLQADALPTSPESYDRYLLARHLFAQRGQERIERSIEILETIVAREPGYGRAWSTLAAAYAVAAGFRDGDYAKFSQLAQRAARDALARNAALAEAHSVLAFFHSDRYAWSDAVDAFEHAVAAEPGDVTTRLWYGITLAAVGALDAAIEQVEAAAKRDPLSAFVHSWLASLYWEAGRTEQAWVAARRASDLGMRVYTMFHLALDRGEDALAVAEWEAFWREENIDTAFVRPLVEAVRDPSRITYALEVIRATEDRADSSQPSDSIVHRLAPYLRLGAVDESLAEVRHLLASLPRRRAVLLTLLWEPDAAPLRSDPRFVELVTETGLVDFWRERGWPEFCAESSGKVTCH